MKEDPDIVRLAKHFIKSAYQVSSKFFSFLQEFFGLYYTRFPSYVMLVLTCMCPYIVRTRDKLLTSTEAVKVD